MEPIRRLWRAILNSPGKRAVAYTGIALTGITLVLFLLYKLPWHLVAEAFNDFSFPYQYAWKDSIWHFFMERDRARLLHGVLVTGLYALFGYAPPVFYLVAHILTILGATAIGLMVADYLKKPWQVIVLVIALSLLPLALQDMLVLKKLHHALAWAMFWWACYFFTEWVHRERWPWLLGTLLFPLSILSYEAVSLLFPVALFLSLSSLKKRAWPKVLAVGLINFTGILGFWLLERLKPAGRSADTFYTNNMGAMLARLKDLPAGIQRLIEAIFQGQLSSEYLLTVSWMRWAAVASAMLVAVAAIWAMLRLLNQSRWKKEGLLLVPVSLTLAGLWIAFMTYVPFMLAGQSPDNDSLRGAAFALFLFLIAVCAQVSKPGRVHAIFTGFCVLWIAIGVYGYTQALADTRQNSGWVNNYVLSIKEQVPAIKEDAIIVVLNSEISVSGCAGLQNMIFNRTSLRCLFLTDNDQENSFTRIEGWLLERQGGRFEGDTIIVQIDDIGRAHLVKEITAEGYPLLPIVWEVSDPLVTVDAIIYPENYENGLRSDLYEYALEHAHSVP